MAKEVKNITNTKISEKKILLLANIMIGFLIGILLFLSLRSPLPIISSSFSIFLIIWLIFVFIAIESKKTNLLLAMFVVSLLIIIVVLYLDFSISIP